MVDTSDLILDHIDGNGFLLDSDASFASCLQYMARLWHNFKLSYDHVSYVGVGQAGQD